MKKIVCCTATLISGILSVYAQQNVGIGTTNPTELLHVNGTLRAEGTITTGGSLAVLGNAVIGGELSTSGNLLIPSKTSTERDAIPSPRQGYLIFNTTTNCLNFFIGNGWNEICGTPVIATGSITTLNCAGATNSGTLTSGTTAAGVSSSVPYTGGNGGPHYGQTVTSTGVTGLTATLNTGTFANGSGSLTYTVTGTPASSGTASFALNIGGQLCTLSRTVNTAQPQYAAGSVFCASGATAVVDVTNPNTGKIWMDRNLGASQAATSSTDANGPANGYGDLYQWGRRSDGHQCRNSTTTSTLSSLDQPAHGNFIVASSAPFDWRSPQNVNLWQGVNGANNPCPSGYRLPTQAEINEERLSWSSNNSTGAFASPLKLPTAGFRNNNNGTLTNVGAGGRYWTSTVNGTSATSLLFTNTDAYLLNNVRALAYSVRCIKD